MKYKQFGVDNPRAIARIFGMLMEDMTSEEALNLISQVEPWERNEVAFIAYNLGGIEFSEYLIRKSENVNNNVKSMSFIRMAWENLIQCNFECLFFEAFEIPNSAKTPPTLINLKGEEEK